MTFAQTWDLSHQPAGLLPPDASSPRSDPPRSDPPRSDGAHADAQWQPDIAQAEAEFPVGRHCRVMLRPVLESAKLARDFTRATLRDWQLDALGYEAVIIASELVTNAVRHGVGLATASAERAGVELAWQRHACRLVCVVTDPSAKPPVLAAPCPEAESGRGLQVVQALAAAWGWMMLSAQEKAVWAALLLPAGSLASRPGA